MAITANMVSSAATSQTTTSKSSLGKDDFLKLLVQQLRNQDPLNPMQGTEFAAQLAQFSSVEQLSNINTNLTTSLNANQLLTQSISNSLASTMIGKEVRASGNTLEYAGTGSQKIGYTLASAADSVTVKITDSYGNTVRNMKTSALDAGDNTLSWDGKDDTGATVAAGKYTLTVTALNAKGTSIQADPYTFGKISAVRFKSDGTVFVVDGLEIPLADVLEIMGD